MLNIYCEQMVKIVEPKKQLNSVFVNKWSSKPNNFAVVFVRFSSLDSFFVSVVIQQRHLQVSPQEINQINSS